MAKRAGVWSAIAIVTVMGSGAARADVPPPPTPTPTLAAPAPATPAVDPTVAPTPAMAATRAAVTPRPASRSRRWYGHQLIIGDFVGFSVTLLGTGFGDGAGALVGAAGWALGVPAIHAVHGNYGRAVLSFGLRQGLTWGAAYVGASLACRKPHSEDYRCEAKGVTPGVALGYLTAAIIDVALVAYEPARPVPTVVPTVAAAPGRVSLGLAGSF